MGSMTFRNLEDELKQSLRAARQGVSMEAEAREILRVVIKNEISVEELETRHLPSSPVSGESAWDVIKRLRGKYGTFDLEIQPRTDMGQTRSIFDE